MNARQALARPAKPARRLPPPALTRTEVTGREDDRPLCIPVTWTADGSYWLAYHHGWRDARFYSVVEIRKAGAQTPFSGYVAAVDDFGNLVPIRHAPYVVRGELELH